MMPSRKHFRFDPMVSDRQLWALGMICVQWTITDGLIIDNAKALLHDDAEALADFNRTGPFADRRRKWIDAIKIKLTEPFKSRLLTVASEFGQLQSLRDEYVHGNYGGMREPGRETRHGGIVRNITHIGGPRPGKKTDFAAMRQVAVRISEANLALLMLQKEICDAFQTTDLCAALRRISATKNLGH